MEGLLTNNPIFAQVLGICSALAVTSKIETSLVMGVGYVFVVASGDADAATRALADAGYSPFRLGRLAAGSGVVEWT